MIAEHRFANTDKLETVKKVNMHLHHTDVLVAGAGPVGLAAALFLHERGRGVIVAEEKPSAGTHSGALALHPASLNLLEDVGVVDDILAHSRLVKTLAVRSGMHRLASVQVAAPEAKHPYLAIAGQDVVERILNEKLKARKIPTWWNHRVARFEQGPHLVTAQLDELEERTTGYAVAHLNRSVARNRGVEAKYLIGADGHGSLVRRQLELDFNEVGAGQHFAVFEFQLDEPLIDEITLVLHDSGMGVLWPLPDGRARWSFEVDPKEFPDAFREKLHEPVQLVGAGIYPALDESFFAHLVRERAPWFQAKPSRMNWRIMVRFERRLVSRLGQGRVWIAGDAAHLAGPVGVQSMNMGLAEARALAGAIARAGPDNRAEPFEAYNEDCLRQWRYLMGLTGSVEASADAPSEIVQHKEELLACLPGYGRELSQIAKNLGLYVSPVDFDVSGH